MVLLDFIQVKAHLTEFGQMRFDGQHVLFIFINAFMPFSAGSVYTGKEAEEMGKESLLSSWLASCVRFSI